MKRVFQRRPSGGENDGLSVLITNITLSGRTGTEIVARDLALGLRRRGHRPIVYTRDSSGPIADELQRASVPVITDIEKLTAPVDIIHGHHTPTVAAAVSKYPDVPAIFVAHDFIAWHDMAPRFGSIRRVCAVDTTVAQRFSTYEGREPSEISLLLNAVDMERFQPGPDPAPVPRKALAFAKNTEHLPAIRQACERRNIELDVVGAAVGKVISSPETELAGYDLVFTSALSALEAMSAGRAVIVCDGRGLAGLVTPENMREWRLRNFGLGCFSKRLDADNVLAEIDRYDAGTLAEITAFVRTEADQETWLDTIEDLYRQIQRENGAEPRSTSFAELSGYIQTWSPRVSREWPWLVERERLTADLKTARLGVEAPECGEEIDFSSLAGGSTGRLVEGFSRREKWGVWSEASTATVLARRPECEKPPSTIRFKLRLFLPPQEPAMSIGVLVNGHKCADWTFGDGDKGQPRTLTCPYPSAAQAEQVWVTFQIDAPRSPFECGVSDDRRKLGLGLISMAFEGA